MANYFSLLLVILTLVTGFIWLIDSLFFAKKRKARWASGGANANGEPTAEPHKPYVVDTAQQIFPIIAFVLVLRSFLYEPFQIPSGSMMPTLLVGDFILVEKYAYGFKDPVTRYKFLDTGKPERGDVAVFKYPENKNLDYIKRIVGLPGDTVIYRNKQLFIKPYCQATAKECAPIAPVELTYVGSGEFVQNMAPLQRFTESLGKVSHDILRHPVFDQPPSTFYAQPGTQIDEWIVPQGHYFVLGDNRDNSRDSRFWGFVSDDNLVGKAVAIWISFEFERQPDSWLPAWVPTGVRFSRVGGID
ncbi:signal peptidase I [Alteromonas sediminis]|uniref:Signal peptidase I n=1 Tax=Alteromonas sediminis TaxID=2259342 RepID=A0A3N5YKU5_9ALTE|nr:signal peptidase I [Alteromonas sediminis]RPJ65601.1 signal peptidase I [Alteromonas sediminis]